LRVPNILRVLSFLTIKPMTVRQLSVYSELSYTKVYSCLVQLSDEKVGLAYCDRQGGSPTWYYSPSGWQNIRGNDILIR